MCREDSLDSCVKMTIHLGLFSFVLVHVVMFFFLFGSSQNENFLPVGADTISDSCQCRSYTGFVIFSLFGVMRMAVCVLSRKFPCGCRRRRNKDFFPVAVDAITDAVRQYSRL